jgi:hypothetical protein
VKSIATSTLAEFLKIQLRVGAQQPHHSIPGTIRQLTMSWFDETSDVSWLFAGETKQVGFTHASRPDSKA